MARSRQRLTVELQQTIAAYIRAGGFAHVAAAAAGVSGPLLDRWLRRGGQPRAPRRYRDFQQAIVQATAQARIRAEAAIFKNRPLDWLRSGPGRESAGNPGWTASARAAPPARPGSTNPLLQREYQDMLATVLQLLAPYPEIRAVAASTLVRSAAQEAP